ncbi:MAG TPA: hypothetical protein VN941_01310 [Bradyrhizobium sp.]|nr:hypothetical protein [Bradyrhizobium sp.]
MFDVGLNGSDLTRYFVLFMFSCQPQPVRWGEWVWLRRRDAARGAFFLQIGALTDITTKRFSASMPNAPHGPPQ